MDLKRLELLRQVIDCGSYSQAARSVGISQPAVSQAMAALSRQAGQVLFTRQGRHLLPTEAALSLAQAAAGVDSLQQQVERALDTGRKKTLTHLRVGLAPAAGLLYGAAMTAAVKAVRPRPLLSIVTGAAPSMLAQLMRGDLDLVIAPRPRGLKPTQGLMQQLMYVSHPVIYARAGNRLAQARSLRAVASAEWVVAGSAGTPSNIVEEAFRVRGWKPPRIAVQCTDHAMLLSIVAQSDLLGVISHPALISHTQGLDVVPVPVTEGLPHYEVCLFWYAANARAWPTGMAQVLQALQALRSGTAATTSAVTPTRDCEAHQWPSA